MADVNAAPNKRYLVVPPKLDVMLGVDRIGDYTREQAETIIWRHTHPDFKGTWEGCKCILFDVPGRGTTMVALEMMTDAQIESRLPNAHKKELAYRASHHLKVVRT